MRKLIIAFPFLLLTGCALEASYIPENSQLKDAEIGVPYYGQINILGGFVNATNRHGEEVLAASINPNDIGISVQQCSQRLNNNCFKIRGFPTKTGLLKINVSGILSGGMLSSGGSFDKTYTITIKNAKP